jgi:hypothetical protein
MTSSRLSLVVAVAAFGLAACGNYSNEDLLFMAAVPTTSQLALVLPAAAPTVTEAELAEDTHNGISSVNTMLDDVLGLVDAIRSNEPTSRSTDSRIWGPYPDSNNPGWQWELEVDRSSDGTSYMYKLQVANVATPDVWVPFLDGSFDAPGDIKQGNGTVMASFSNLKAAGFPLDNDTLPLQTLRIDYQNYQTPGSPVTVTLAITRTPDLPNGVSSLTFTYEILADGSGEIVFTLTGNVVPGPATEIVTINSLWIPSGAGRATLAVVSGDGAGMAQTECWDGSFEATYNDKPWSTTEDLGVPADLGNPAICPTAPSF